ncbi:lysosomal acid glucosylceramidase-like [Sitodiplosis mosellana]|uniref:lysosomal acid glucosylceramidase-like n=1 Tax=Sitodiplosis mosellana TaxID=263140 RepID=UPI0024448FAB|nr:lysosomal acid glucosylceramidase-like [Sitodiplosis mosellana]
MSKQTVKICTKFLFIVSLVVCLSLAEQTSRPCLPRWLDKDSLVCVCTSAYCDTLETPEPIAKNDYVFVSSSEDGDRFNFILGKFPRRNRYSSMPAPLDVSKTYVKIKDIINGRQFHGMGGTYTGSTAYVTSLMSTTLQRHVYKSFYSPNNGTNLSIVRVPIGSTKNKVGKQWTYNENPPNDSRLTNFSAFNREDRLRLCQLKQLKRIAKNPSIEFMAVASKAPEWMTRTILNGKRNVLKREFYQTWADYHLKYLQMMDNECIRFSSISTGQRPDSSYNSPEYSPLAWDPYEQGKWLANNLGPTLRASNFSNITIIAYDDSRQSIPYFASSMNVGDKNAMRFVDAIGIQNEKNRYYLSTVLDLTYAAFPSKAILNTESSFPDVKLGSWNNAEALALDIIDNLQHDSLGYIVNNLILNLDGGPGITGEKQDAPILVSKDSTEFYKQPMFYVLAHFSKYITPGSVRLDTFTDKYLDILTVAYLRPDDKIVVSMYNRLNNSVAVVLTDLYQGAVELQLKPKSINTLIY